LKRGSGLVEGVDLANLPLLEGTNAGLELLQKLARRREHGKAAWKCKFKTKQGKDGRGEERRGEERRGEERRVRGWINGTPRRMEGGRDGERKEQPTHRS